MGMGTNVWPPSGMGMGVGLKLMGMGRNGKTDSHSSTALVYSTVRLSSVESLYTPAYERTQLHFKSQELRVTLKALVSTAIEIGAHVQPYGLIYKN